MTNPRADPRLTTDAQYMISALFDMVLYLTERGPYNPLRLQALYGLRRAKSGCIDATEKSGQTAIIYVCGRVSLVSWIIMYITNGPMSHTAVLLDSKTIFHATPRGVAIEPIENILNGKSLIVLRWFDTPEVEKAQAFARSQVGKPYGWAKVLYIGWLSIMGCTPNYNKLLLVDAVATAAAISWCFHVNGMPVLAGPAAFLLYSLVVAFNSYRLSGTALANYTRINRWGKF